MCEGYRIITNNWYDSTSRSYKKTEWNLTTVGELKKIAREFEIDFNLYDYLEDDECLCGVSLEIIEKVIGKIVRECVSAHSKTTVEYWL